VDLDTKNGDVVLSLPAGASAHFIASTTNGTVTVTGFLPDYDGGSNYPNLKVGDIGAGDADITISTANGNVMIKVR